MMQRIDRSKIEEMRSEVDTKVDAAYDALRITWENLPGQDAATISETIFQMLEQQGLLISFMKDDRVYGWIDQVEAKAQEEFGDDSPQETPRTESREEMFVRELKAALGPDVHVTVIDLDEEEAPEKESLYTLRGDY
jgi:hypothetical protein